MFYSYISSRQLEPFAKRLVIVKHDTLFILESHEPPHAHLFKYTFVSKETTIKNTFDK